MSPDIEESQLLNARTACCLAGVFSVTVATRMLENRTSTSIHLRATIYTRSRPRHPSQPLPDLMPVFPASTLFLPPTPCPTSRSTIRGSHLTPPPQLTSPSTAPSAASSNPAHQSSPLSRATAPFWDSRAADPTLVLVPLRVTPLSMSGPPTLRCTVSDDVSVSARSPLPRAI
ncbi:hypothetical protein K439DRAFT_561235 [Ramaria rubella]|nr:hypothetical protein K439DRAFT_561235 [Ramaria rubella]